MMTKSNVGKSSLVPVLFVLTLFLLLAFTSVSVILAGGNVYEKISGNMEKNYDKRVALSYLTTKIRQNDGGGNIYAEDKNGVKMLAIKETDGSDEYVTYIYYYGGYIREIYLGLDKTEKTIGFDLNYGEKIIESKGFTFDMSGDSIKISLTDMNGNLQSAQVTLRSQS